MEINKIIVIGASAGGVEALKLIVRALPPELPAAVFVVVHTGSEGHMLDVVLGRCSALPVSTAGHGEPFKAGQVYVAPADHHLTLDASGRMCVSKGPRENRFRPAVDPLFRSAAAAFGSRVIGVILSGGLDDGSAGLWAVKELGGMAVIQDPEDAIMGFMPLNALKRVRADHCVPASQIAALLAAYAAETPAVESAKPIPEKMKIEVKMAQGENGLSSGILNWGEPSMYSCPECNGTLMQIMEGSLPRFRCHTGHAYSVEALFAEIRVKTEEAIWNALRCFEETILLSKRMASLFNEHSHQDQAQALLKRAEDAQIGADRMREAIGTK